MRILLSSGRLALFGLALVFCISGCHKNPTLTPADNNQAGTLDQSSDPASANLAPVSSNSGSPAPESAGVPATGPAAETSSVQQSAPPPANSSVQQSAPPPDAGVNYDQASGQAPDNPGYGEQPEYTAAQPPPPLPDYDQPPAPGDGYLWTPGYWAWGPGGYYWVPGAWVQAPYEGALWTPGYWGYWHDRYQFYPGYWGQYIGFYGGIDYGFGYIGFGYQGGYWGGGHFNYNRSFNNMNGSRAQYIYNRPMSNYQRGSRVSYNGGSGGLQVRARPAELAALRQPHTAPMRAQVQNERAARNNRAQFASANHGRPANVAVSRPLAADRNVRAPAALQETNRAVGRQRVAAEARRSTTQPARAMEPSRSESSRTAPGRQETRQAAPQRSEQRQAAPQRSEQRQAPRQAAPQRSEQRQAPRQAAPQRSEQRQAPRQAAPQRSEQRQAPRQAAPQRSEQRQAPRQAAPQRSEQRQAPRQAAPQRSEQRQAAPQREAAPQQRQAEERPKK